MITLFDTPSRFRPLIDFCAIVALCYLLKVVLDQFMWRYSGSVWVGIMLSVIFLYLRIMGKSWSWIGLVKIKSRKGFGLLPFQEVLAFIAILASASALSLAGESLGPKFMKPDNSGAQNRFGDDAGNT